MKEIILQIAGKDKTVLALVRCIDKLMAAEDDHSIWIRGITDSDYQDTALQQLPVLHSFYADAQGYLFRKGQITPIGKVPELNWIRLNKFLAVELPVSLLPGTLDTVTTIKLIPSPRIRESVALLTSLEVWKQYGETASQIRLNNLVFAVSDQQQVLIMGSPLPSLPGKEFWAIDSLLIPNGYEPEIMMAVGFLTAMHNSSNNSYLLADENQRWQSISKSSFVPARRSAIRLSSITQP
ncbi:hypothetical protein HHL16_04350 [Pseudoflavitalea sp. G-6-1-2]|uniref:hypothetical protein n=1 Tax=Pseudoflavitalea sp. G-6-1-2 TaxID=2728841 RepID=UPI00146D2D06|nr:hypothetical protein [Pseudoflavitalea sp. G-6-1-2]NML20090.1 hypothetical protein [Pseudoflavitalea sp. G-6-1-2]